MTTYYTTSGPVRGDCGHRHRTIAGAVRCRESDAVGCARQGGYSDREVVRCDGEDMDEVEYAALTDAIDRIRN